MKPATIAAISAALLQPYDATEQAIRSDFATALRFAAVALDLAAPTLTSEQGSLTLTGAGDPHDLPATLAPACKKRST